MLSEEEKKAIEQLKVIKNAIDKKYIKTRNSNSINIILKLITKLQKENEEQKTTINKQSLDISNNLIELQQKDKQIFLMARAFKQDDIRTIEEIIQYFATKAKKGE